MSIEIKGLVKRYGPQVAVNGISFEVQKGEILGFLGPNGAGKSTTMKIATGFLPPTAGEVLVNGANVVTETIAAKKSIGYLPEHNPLYLDMYVKEFLSFTGSMYGMKGAPLTQSIDRVIGMTGLGQEMKKKIGALSKGYRQRVGLAQTMVHNPPVLILDEPTTGLDPNQIVEIRNMIREIGREKTVIFSTHIMQEVQSVCSRYLIIHKGNIAAKGQIGGKTESKIYTLETDKAVDALFLESNILVASIQFIAKGLLEIELVEEREGKASIIRHCADNDIDIKRFGKKETNLEQIFKDATSAA